MIIDNTGRKLKIGQIVHLLVMGLVPCKVAGIKEQPLLLSPQQQIPPHILLQAQFTPFVREDGSVEVYILREPDPKDPLILNAKEEGIIRTH